MAVHRLRTAVSRQAHGTNPEYRSLDQIETFQPSSFMVLTQSSGKYDMRRKMFKCSRPSVLRQRR